MDRRASHSRRVLVLGDLCLDTVVSDRLPVTWHSAASSGEPLLQVPITDQAGGTAYQFARYAPRFGLQPTIVGCIGEDAAAELIIGELTAAGIGHRLQRSPSAPTARSLVAYDARGVRFMFTSSVNANDELSAEFVRCIGPQRWDLVWLSGLCLRSRTAPRFLAVAEAVAYARECGALVLLDVVPHKFHRLFGNLEEVSAVLGELDGVVSELTSALRLLRLELPGESSSAEMLSATAAALLETTPFAVLQFHDGTTFHQLAVSRSRFRNWYSRPVPAGSKFLGYGDVLAGEAVRDYLVHRAANSTGRELDVRRDQRPASHAGEVG